MTKPWISSVILKKCKHRDALLNYISKETGHLIKNVLRIDYKKLRNEITKDNALAKQLISPHNLKITNKTLLTFVKGIRSLVNIKSLKSSSCKLLDNNHNQISDPKKISIIFNDHYSTIGSAIEQKLSYAMGILRII